MNEHLKDMSLLELFRMEAESQLAILTEGLLASERGETNSLEQIMRAAHSLKGAGRIVGIGAVVAVTHAMEDCLVAAQRGEVVLGRAMVDQLLSGVDLLARIAQAPETDLPIWAEADAGAAVEWIRRLRTVSVSATAVAGRADEGNGVGCGGNFPEQERAAASPVRSAPLVSDESRRGLVAEKAGSMEWRRPKRLEVAERGETPEVPTLRVTAENLNRLLGLASESLVASRWIRPFGASVSRLKRFHSELDRTLFRLRARLYAGESDLRIRESLAEAQECLEQCRGHLAGRLEELETHERRSAGLAQRLYGEALAVRMRPFSDGMGGLARMVRDIARSLGKEVRLEMIGEGTQVDREVLAKLEAPLGHLVRNAVDHGIELPAVRLAAGKPAEGTVTLEARHRAGRLWVSVRDDGCGVDPAMMRAAVVRKNLVSAEVAPRLSEVELLEFLFLPGFTLRETVTEISGRGVGLDVVQSMVKAVRGTVRAVSVVGQGMQCEIQLPLTLSVVRALLVEVVGEPYAMPLGFIAHTLRLAESAVASTEGRAHFAFEGRRTGLVNASQVLGHSGTPRAGALSVVVVGEGARQFGVVVDRFLGERECVVQALDPRLGKIKDISAGSVMEDGAPVLIIDMEDFVCSVEKIAAGAVLGGVLTTTAAPAVTPKRILVVDDSLTVRELERKLLEGRGYAVQIAVDGMEGWNAVRTGVYDLVITDVDMPRLDGVELTTLIKQDAKLGALPVMIVSYKDREEDRRRGLDAGADYYLTKGSFHDDTMLNAVRDLIGDAVSGSEAGS